MNSIAGLLKKYTESRLFIHRSLYLLGLMVILSGLAWSNFLMSLGQFILAGNWILEGDFKAKFDRLKSNSVFFALISTYLLLAIGLIWSEDIDYALHDLRIKLPLLLLPFFIASARTLKKTEWKILLMVYLSSLFIISLFSYYKLIEFFGDEILDKRQLSIRISHIRYGLNLALASILSAFYFKLYGKKFGFVMLFLSLWFLTCLFTFQLYTGLICFFISLFILGIYKLIKAKKRSPYVILMTILIIVISLIAYKIHSIKSDLETKVQLDYDQKQTKGTASLNGEPYWHDLKSKQKENGVFVYRFIAWEEIEKQWNQRSEIKFDGKDQKNQVLMSTLCRFLSSKGLKKDSVGIAALTDEEIEAIENGIANVYFLDHSSIEDRIYGILYEFHQYSKSGYLDGYSIVMRFEYWKTALQIVDKNFLYGVGTGDVEKAFEKQYEKNNSQLTKKYRKKTHNQYLAIFVAIGAPGFAIFLFSLFYPLFYIPKQFLIPYLSFFIIVSLSFLTEDTLETQAGVTFFACFNSLFLLEKAHSQSD